MAGGDPDDIYRSLRRYVSLVLRSPPWTVRLHRARVADDERPVAVLEPGLLGTPQAREGGFDQGDVQKSQTITVMMYPAVQDTASASAELARQITNLMDAGFSRGLVTDDVPPKNIGGPYRLPVYDFAGVPLEGEDRAGPDDPYMHARVLRAGFTVRAIQDPLDELRYSIAATIPLTWWMGGRIPPTAPIAVGVPGAWGGEVGPGG